MRKQAPQEYSARVVALALATWGVAVMLASLEGVFARISPQALAGLALFAILYAPATFLLDATLRRFALDAASRFIAAAALALDVAIAIAVVAIAGEEGPWLASLARPAYAFVALFMAPLAAVAHLAWLERAAKKTRKSAARSPGATPAST